jgi:CDP-glucose 4,6-dehydratase
LGIRRGALGDMEMTEETYWANRRVFVTGHTGFKGAWLVNWLLMKGARVSGYALAPESARNMFDLTDCAGRLEHNYLADVRDGGKLAEAVASAQPELILHMAAQPLVRRSYVIPAETWDVNVMGTVNLLEAARQCGSVRAIVVVTTDKCYENQGWHWGYREHDVLGGHDPYSASKAAAELVVASYRRSFFSNQSCLLASARAGNVIGGGDWSEDRLIPDAARAIEAETPLVIRNPGATRPWQHVLDCLNGYLTLSRKLLSGSESCASAYNIGPDTSSNLSVHDILTRLKQSWPQMDWEVRTSNEDAAKHEAAFLYLDSSKAKQELGWKPVWSIDEALRSTAEWYVEQSAKPAESARITMDQIKKFESDSNR